MSVTPFTVHNSIAFSQFTVSYILVRSSRDKSDQFLIIINGTPNCFSYRKHNSSSTIGIVLTSIASNILGACIPFPVGHIMNL